MAGPAVISGTDIPFIASAPVDDPEAGLVVLHHARSLLVGAGWAGPKSHARDSRGNECPVSSARAVSFSAGAAIVRARTELGLDVWAGICAQRLLARATTMNPVEFNRSCRDRRDLLEGFDRAIRIGNKLSEEQNGKAQKVG